jgi:hypothetical protein
MKVQLPFSVRHAVADTFAMVIFCFAVGMVVEILISGMTFEQSLASRLLSIPVNMAIAWPYGIYRDWFITVAGKVSASKVVKLVADLLAFVSFQLPVYAGILFSVGASPDQIITAVASTAVISCGMGVVYGQFLEICRRWFRVPGYCQQA